jgi:hypothetical protein
MSLSVLPVTLDLPIFSHLDHTSLINVFSINRYCSPFRTDQTRYFALKTAEEKVQKRNARLVNMPLEVLNGSRTCLHEESFRSLAQTNCFFHSLRHDLADNFRDGMPDPQRSPRRPLQARHRLGSYLLLAVCQDFSSSSCCETSLLHLSPPQGQQQVRQGFEDGVLQPDLQVLRDRCLQGALAG